MNNYLRWRKSKGLTQAQAAKLAKMGKSTWGCIERGEEVSEVYRMAADRLIATDVDRLDTSPERVEIPANNRHVSPNIDVTTLNEIDPEATLVGSALLSSDVIAAAHQIVEPHDFINPANALIFDYARMLFVKGRPVDFISVTDQLRVDGLLEDVGGATYVADLVNSLVGLADVPICHRLMRANADAKRRSLTPALPSNGHAPAPYTFMPGSVRTETEDGVIWFNLGDVCKTIDHSDPSKAALLVEEDDRKKVRVIDSLNREQAAWFISEPGLYQLLGATNVPKAKPFKRWVSREVIPSIRQTGSYSAAPAQPDPLTQHIASIADLIGYVGQSQRLLEQQVSQQQARIEEVAAAVANVDQVVEDRLAAAELERRLVADGRGWIKRSVNLIAKRTEQRHSSVYAALFFALRVSRLDDVQARDQVLRAVDWLRATAADCDLILPAYQMVLPGVAV